MNRLNILFFVFCFLLSFDGYSGMLPIELKREVINGQLRLMLNDLYLLKDIRKMDQSILIESQRIHEEMVEGASKEYKEFLKNNDINPFARSTKEICAFVIRKMEDEGKGSNYNSSSDIIFTRENIDMHSSRWPILVWKKTLNNTPSTHLALFNRYGALIVYRVEAFIPFSLFTSNEKKISSKELSQLVADETHTDIAYWEESNSDPNFPSSSYVELEGNPKEFVFVRNRSRQLAKEFFSNNYVFPLQNKTVLSLLFNYKEDHGKELVNIDKNGTNDLLVIEAVGSNEHNLVKIEATIIQVSGALNYHNSNLDLCLRQNFLWENSN